MRPHRPLARALVPLALALGAAAAAQELSELWFAQPFRAVMEMDAGDGQTATMQVWVGDRVLRQEMTMGGGSQVVLVRFEEDGYTLQTWSDASPAPFSFSTSWDEDDGDMGDLLRLTVPLDDPRHACEQPGWSCERLGRDQIAGRDAIGLRSTDPDGATQVVWLDAELGYPLRTEDEDGTFEVVELVVGPQPSELFVAPTVADAGDPFAPRPETPEAFRADEGCAMHAAMFDQPVPSAGAVGLPAYPGAVYSAQTPAYAGDAGDEILPSVTLLSGDPPAVVADHYEASLPAGWQRGALLGMHVFYRADAPAPEDALMETVFGAMGGEPLVMIQEVAFDCETRLVPEAATSIQIFYEAP